ncbi:MAG: hypothetical protein IKA54_01210 [Clostridia bacterium]|nr:hypothetical protein [Clostridia bacterium]
MYIVVLLVNGEYFTYPFTDLNMALDFSIEHYKSFVRLTDKNLDTIYNELDANGLGGFIFKYYCEKIG